MHDLKEVISEEQGFKPKVAKTLEESSKETSSNWKEKLQNKLAPSIQSSCTLLGSGEVIKFRPMNTRDLKSLLIYQSTSDPLVLEDVLDNLITSVVLNENFVLDNLYVHDKSFLLLNIRILSKGGELESMFSCSKCKQMALFNKNLRDLKVINKPNDLRSKMEISDGFSLYLDYNTRGEQKEMFKLVSSHNEEERTSELGMLSLAGLIKALEIDGEMITSLEPKDKYDIFMSLPEASFEKLIEWDKKSFFGFDLSYTRTCPHCKNIDTIEFPMSSMF